MNVQKKSEAEPGYQFSQTGDSNRRKKWYSARNLMRCGMLMAVAGVLVSVTPGDHVLASAAQATAPDSPEVDADAIEALNKMGAYLRTLKSFQIISDVTNDDVLDDGQVVQTTSKVDLLASKPNRLRVEVTSDDRHRLFLYDGKNFTVWARLVNYYATVPAPPTIAELFKAVDEKYDVQLPLFDLFKWGTEKNDAKNIKGAIDVGPGTVDGVTCEHYIFHQDNVDWQIWIQLGDYPLPRKLVIRTLDDDARPQHSDVLTWNLAPSFNNEAFVFDPPPDAKRIVLAADKGDLAGKGK